jgi:hypothetical protein
MKSDDERLALNWKELIERRKKIDDLRLAVISGHLMMEETLDRFLEASVYNPEKLKDANLGFRQKGYLAWALARFMATDELWYVLWSINELRNRIAHDLDAADIQAKMKYLRQQYVRALSLAQAKDAESQPDHVVAESACLLCAGFLATLTDHARKRREHLNQWMPDGGHNEVTG